MTTAFLCAGCGRSWVFPAPPTQVAPCRWCGGATQPVDVSGAEVARPPEHRVLPRIEAREAARLLKEWVQQVPFAGPELTGTAELLAPVWVPRWLVDIDARAVFEATVGFPERVRSSTEVLVRGTWRRQEVEEERTRWEPRLGRVERRYDNLRVDGLAAPGVADLAVEAPGVPVDPPRDLDAPWMLPDRTPKEQLPGALSALRAAVAADCARAAGGTDVKDLRLELAVTTAEPFWTLLLVPVFVGNYRDDEGRTHTLTVNAVTGACAGRRLASRAVAAAYAGRQTAIGLAAMAFAAFLAMIGVIVWFLLPAAAVVGLVGLGILLSGRAAGPAVAAWNRTERAE